MKVSKDETPLLLHDDTLDRTTNGAGLVCDFTFDEIIKLDAGSFFYKSETGIKVPSLSSALDLVKKYKNSINIELKPNKDYEVLNVKKTLEVLKKINYEKVYFSSFDLLSCITLRESSSELSCGFLNDSFNKINIKDTIDICKKYNFFSCGINYDYFSKSIVDEFKKNNIQIVVYSDNNISTDEAKNLWNNNVASIFVDDPRLYFK